MKSWSVASVVVSAVVLATFLLPSQGAAQGLNQALADAAMDKEVRVTGIDGSRQTGRLVSVSDSEIVLRRNSKEQRQPLTTVQRIDRVGHRVRNWAIWGAAIGGGTAAMVGYRSLRLDGMDADEVRGVTVLWAGVGMAAGASLGALVERVSAPGKRIYQSSMKLSPIVSPRRQAVALTMQW